MRRLVSLLILSGGLASACADDDGSSVRQNTGGSGGTLAGSAGTGEAGGSLGSGGGSGSGGSGGSAESGGSAGDNAGAGGSGGSTGCTPMLPGPADASMDGGDAGVIFPVSFAADVHPIFAAKCGPCHVTEGFGGHNVGGELEQAYLDAVRLADTLLVRIDGGGMPPVYAEPPNNCGAEGGAQPGDPGCLTVAEVALVASWIAQCNPR